MTAVLVPLPGTDLVPDGWCESTVMPWADQQVEQGELATATAKVDGLIAAYRTLDADALELVKARRYLEVRWGELLGKATDIKTAPGRNAYAEDEALNHQQRHEFRRLAEHKEEVVEALRAAESERDVSRGALLAKVAHVAQSSGHIEWYTPTRYTDAARKVMGNIDLDPASCAEANKTVRAERFYSEEDDGLDKQWSGRVWMNPPYRSGLIEKFCVKLRDSYVADDISEAVVLVNNATETNWFQTLARVANAFCFPAGRISFVRSDRPSFTPLQGQAFLYFGAGVDVFAGEFSQFGFVVRP